MYNINLVAFSNVPIYGFYIYQIILISGSSPSVLSNGDASVPDITLHCNICKSYINVSELSAHVRFHKALEQLHYFNGQVPKTLQDLNARRLQLVREFTRNANSFATDTSSMRLLKHLDEAYDNLKSELFKCDYQFNPSVVLDDETDRSSSYPCSSGFVRAVGISTSINRKWKSRMEENAVFTDCFGNDPNKCYFGIFAGYNGQNVANVAADRFDGELLMQMDKFNTDISLEIDNSEFKAEALHQKASLLISDIIAKCEDNIASLSKSNGRNSNHSASSRNKIPGLEKYAKEMSAAFKAVHNIIDDAVSSGYKEKSRLRWSGCSTLACVVQSIRPSDESRVASSANSNCEDVEEFNEQKKRAVMHLANAGTF